MSDATLTRNEIRSLLEGGAPDSEALAKSNGWSHILKSLHDAHTQEGQRGVVRLFNGLVKVDKNLSRLMATSQPASATAAIEYPTLPGDAQEIYRHDAPCGEWLDHYVSFATEAAPMTPRSFHEAAGLFAVSTAIARRLVLHTGMIRHYPNLYFLFVSPSTIDHKSTGLHLLEDVMRRGNMGHLLMPRKASPQAFVADLDHHKLPSPRQMQDLSAFLQRRAFAAQRGWVREEVSALFASLKQEYNAGLLELILEMYDCPDHYDELTISRGEGIIHNGYLSFFGVSTPVEMATHFANLSFWSNGLWARCMVITPEPAPRPFVFFPRRVNGADVLSAGLQRIYDLFPVPVAELKEIETQKGKTEQVIEMYNQQAPSPAQLAPGVWDSWEAYCRAVGYTLLQSGEVDQELFACYGRLGTLAMKVAMLLATMDAEHLPVHIEMAHLARAQRLVEHWRAGLHRLWNEQSATQDTRLGKRIAERLTKAGSKGMTVRDLCQALRAPAKEIQDSLIVLEKSGQVQTASAMGKNGRAMEMWQWAQ